MEVIMEKGITMPTNAVCLECGDPIAYGRLDKKFCSSACKNRYHNRETHDRHSVRLRVVNILDRNYSILESLLAMKTTSIKLCDISLMGFNKEFMTSCRKAGSHMECWCFDICYYCTATRICNVTIAMSRR